MIELHPGTAETRISPKMFLISDLAWSWWKMIELHPGTAETRISPEMIDSWDLPRTWWKMIELQPRYFKPEYHLKFLEVQI